MIVGGFNGKFLNDYYKITDDKNNGKQLMFDKKETNMQNGGSTQTLQLFPFQVPTLGDSAKGEVMCVDWQHMALYQFKNGQWSYKLHVKSK